MDAAAELGRNPLSKHHIQPEYGDEQADAGRGCRNRLARPVLGHERGQGKIHFPCTADHEQDWQPSPVDLYSCYMWWWPYTCVLCPPASTAALLRLLSGEYRWLLLDYAEDIYVVGDPLCPLVLILNPKNPMYILLPLAALSLTPPPAVHIVPGI